MESLIDSDIAREIAADLGLGEQGAPASPEVTATVPAKSKFMIADEQLPGLMDYLGEKVGRKIENIEYLQKEISEAESLRKWKAEHESLIPQSEEAKAISKFLGNNNTIDNYIKWKQLDIEKLTDIDKIAKMYELRDKLPQDQAEALAYTRFAVDELFDKESQQYKALIASTTLEARQASEYLSEHKKGLEVPSARSNEFTLEQVQANWGATIDNIINKEENKMTFSFDNERFEFEFPKESRMAIEKKIGNMLTTLANQGIDISTGNKEVADIIRNMAKTEATMLHQKEIINAFMTQYKTNMIKAKANLTPGMAQSRNSELGGTKITSNMSGDEIGELIVQQQGR